MKETRKIVRLEDGGAMGTHIFFDDPQGYECAKENNRQWLGDVFREASNRVDLNELRRKLTDAEVQQVTKYIHDLLEKRGRP